MQGTQVWALVWELRFPHASGQQSLWATTTEPVVLRLRKPRCLESVIYNKRSHCNEKPMHSARQWSPLTSAREGLHAATNTQCSQTKINLYIYIYIVSEIASIPCCELIWWEPKQQSCVGRSSASWAFKWSQNTYQHCVVLREILRQMP